MCIGKRRPVHLVLKLAYFSSRFLQYESKNHSNNCYADHGCAASVHRYSNVS